MSSFLSTCLWTAVILVVMSTRSTTMAQDCSDYQEQVEFGPGITLDYTVVQDEDGDAVLRGRMTYQNSGYVAIGFPQEPGGGMVGATAIIGLLDEPLQMWDLLSYSADGVVPSTDASVQALVQGRFVQNEEGSVLEFEVPVDEALNLVADGSTESSLIWAVGGSNTLSYHASRGLASVTLDICTTGQDGMEDNQEEEEDTGGDEETDNEEDAGEEGDGEEEEEMPPAGGCSGFQEQVEFVEGVTLDYTVVEENAQVVMKGKMTYQHSDSAGGYVAIGFSESGGMVGSKAIIGLLDEELQMWDLTSYSLPGVIPSDADGQDLLVDGSFVQSAEESVLEFVVVVDETELNLVADGATESQLIWAVGGSNMLSYHAGRGSSAVTLDVCVEGDSGEDTEAPTAAPVTEAPTAVMETDPPSPSPVTAAPTVAPTTMAPPTAAPVPADPSEPAPATDAPVAEPQMMSPTVSPVGLPMVTTAAPMSLPPPTESPEASSSCVADDPDQEVLLWIIVSGQLESCTWLADQPADVQSFHCETYGRIARHCAVTCDTCRNDDCEDDTSYQFRIFAPTTETCSWLDRRNKSRRKRRICERSPEALDLCPTTCDENCGE